MIYLHLYAVFPTRGDQTLWSYFCDISQSQEHQQQVLNSLLCSCHGTLEQTYCENQTLMDTHSLNKAGRLQQKIGVPLIDSEV